MTEGWRTSWIRLNRTDVLVQGGAAMKSRPFCFGEIRGEGAQMHAAQMHALW